MHDHTVFSPIPFFSSRIHTETESGDQKWAKMLVMVSNIFYDLGRGRTNRKTQNIFVMMSGRRTNEKRDLANQALRDWQVDLKKKVKKSKKKVKKGEETRVCPYYSPSTQNLELRTFLAKLKDQYDFRFVLRDFNNFEGSLGGVMAAVYRQRYEEWVRQ